MYLPWLRQLDELWLRLLAVAEMTLPFCLLTGLLLTRFFVSEKLNWKKFPSMVPLIVAIIPAVTALHERFLGSGVVFAFVYVVSFVLLGMREHMLFYDCALPISPPHKWRWPRWLVAFQVFWFLQAPAAAFNGLNWPRGFYWTQTVLTAIALSFWIGLIVADTRNKAKI